MKPTILILALLPTAIVAPAQYDISDYGAKPGELSTAAIQAAVDAAHAAGGGQVVVPAGIFVTGTITLHSNIDLHLAPGAILQGSTNLDDYARDPDLRGIIFCDDAINVSITGRGTIDARGTTFYDPTRSHAPLDFKRERTRQQEAYLPANGFHSDGPIKRLAAPGICLVFQYCTRVTLQDFTLRDTPNWGIRLANCEDVRVTGLTIRNNLMVPNSDGVHCTISRNVRVSDCDISAGDDAIVVTSFPVADTGGAARAAGEKSRERSQGNHLPYAENFTVTNCVLQSRSSCIRVGYGQYPIRHCTFSNLVLHGSNRGIGIFAHDAVDIEDLLFANITIETRLHNGQWWGNGEPIHLSSITRFSGKPVGRIRNVRFTDIVATSEHGILVYGDAASPMENIAFDHVDVTIVNGRETRTYGGNFDLRPTADRDLAVFKHDIPGLYARHVNGLALDGVTVHWGEGLPDFFTYAVETENVIGLGLTNLTGTANPSSSLPSPFHFAATSFAPRVSRPTSGEPNPVATATSADR